MGCTYYSYAIIGYKISNFNSSPIAEYTQCDHYIPDGAQFCPTCGKKVIIETSELMDDWDEFVDNLPENYIFVEPQESDFAYIGYGIESSDESGEGDMIDLETPATIKKKLKTLLKEYIKEELIELDDSEFGLWTVLTASC